MDVGRRNNIHTSGASGPPLVFAHGLGCDQRIWRQLVPRLERDHRIAVFDHVGCGRSDPAAYDAGRYGSLDAYASDLAEVVRATGWQAPTLVAHSAAGAIGLLAAAADPGLFSRIVTLAFSPCYLNHPPDYLGGFEPADLDEMLTLMQRNFLGWAQSLASMAAPQSQLAQELVQGFCDANPLAVRRFSELVLRSDLRELLPRIQVPVLIVQSVHDPIAPLAVGEYAGARLPRAEIFTIDAPGHLPHMTDPDSVERAIRRFVG